MKSLLIKKNGYHRTVEDIIRDTLSHNDNNDDAFYVVDIEDIVAKHDNWLLKMPRVRPYFAVKCNPNPVVLQIMSALGIGFDCASKGEIETVLKLGVSPNDIIYANPCKSRSFIKYAAEMGVDLVTFDNELELYKLKQCHPNSRLVIRIKVDDSHAKCPLGLKFGANRNNVSQLLETAKSLGLQVVGCSFHVGSNCRDAQSYSDAIANAKYVLELGREVGFQMTILDIGGGFPGTAVTADSFEDMSRAVSDSLDIHFPEVDKNPITIIGEPGRYYVAPAFTLVTNIIGKRTVLMDDLTSAQMYYLNDGVYGSFNCTVYDAHRVIEPKPLLSDQIVDNRQTCVTTVWGPTCDSIDCIRSNVLLPEMHIGEWLVFTDMGAYTVSAGSEFNGFKMPSFHYYVSFRTLRMLQQLANWKGIENLLVMEDENANHITIN